MDLAETDFQRAIYILNTKMRREFPRNSSKFPGGFHCLLIFQIILDDKYKQRWREILQDFYIIGIPIANANGLFWTK